MCRLSSPVSQMPPTLGGLSQASQLGSANPLLILFRSGSSTPKRRPLYHLPPRGVSPPRRAPTSARRLAASVDQFFSLLFAYSTTASSATRRRTRILPRNSGDRDILLPKMKAVVITSPGGPDVLQVRDVEDPVAGEGEVVIRVAAAGLNRADTLQRKGSYPPPPGASSYPGLECSGVVEAVGNGVRRWKVGDQVCALITGGGYAEKVAVPEGQVLPVPAGVSLQEAAGIPEVACTVWSTVFMTSHLAPGESFLVHGGSSGIGTFAIQIAKHLGVKVFTTAGSAEKLAICKDLGADVCINYKTEDFVARVKEETGGKGVDVILDNMGGLYFQRNIESLSVDGRLFIIGFQGGTAAEVNLGPLLVRRLTVQAAGLRSRSTENKARIVTEVEKHVWPAIADGKVKPVIYKSFPLSEAAEAHRLMESSAHVGKILLVP